MSINDASRERRNLQKAIDSAARLLPAQGPIRVFIHHNTLHAFEDRVFEDAVFEAGMRFDARPLLSEAEYRTALNTGRIDPSDLAEELERTLGADADETVAGLPRREFRRRLLVHGLRDAQGPALNWILNETDTLFRLRPDAALPQASKSEVVALWQACTDAVRSSPSPPVPSELAPIRHRDVLLSTVGVDTDRWIQPLLIRFVGSYLDQGVAAWVLPGRERGLHGCFLALYGSHLAGFSADWARTLSELVLMDQQHDRDGWGSVCHSLFELGVDEAEWESFLSAEALSLRGWAGMVRQLELRPDRASAIALGARFVDFLAILLLAERAAVAEAIRQAQLGVAVRDLRGELRGQLEARTGPSLEERCWRLFDVAQVAGLDAAAVRALAPSSVERIELELHDFDANDRRLLLHLAYEVHLRKELFDAIVQHPGRHPDPVALQAIFCIDEREESFRRHLEEANPDIETLGVAGFFGVAMYFRATTDAQSRPLCPASMQPDHYVTEAPVERDSMFHRIGRHGRRWTGTFDRELHAGSRSLGRGALIMTALGALWLLPLVLRVLFPWFRHGVSRLQSALGRFSPTRLLLKRTSAPPPLGRYSGFDVDEMAQIVVRELEPLGIAGRLARLVVVVGHGSTSLNNPQESAHDCGACGGGRGGANARAFAQMANDPAVRQRMAMLGVTITANTWFVGAERNTANNDVVFFDVDLVPPTHRQQFDRARADFDIARRNEAHERCRRFEGVPAWITPAMALFHVQNRAQDLAQPRPEFGHASNAACIVGRRARTCGLFLDRRCFLASYDPTNDTDGALLGRLLGSIVPVVLGINLEYFFGYVDPVGYGSGTKLPHNITGLLGVMDGAQSDLRTGLPWQMLEIHEPVRLTLVVEARPEVLERVLLRHEELHRLVRNRWLFLACLHPSRQQLMEFCGNGFRPYCPGKGPLVVSGGSIAHYRGHQEHLPFVSIESRPEKGQAA